MSLTALQKSLIVLAAALLGALGWITDWGQNINEVEVRLTPPQTKPDGASVLPDFKLSADASAYSQITERPLLNPTRRPAPTQAAVAVAPEPPKPQIRRGLYQLVGVSDFGNLKVAQLRELSTNRTRTVKQGDSLQEMQVKSIEPSRVVLSFLGETDTLELAKFTASGRVPQPQQPAAVPVPAQANAQPVPTAAQPTPIAGITPVASLQPPPSQAVASAGASPSDPAAPTAQQQDAPVVETDRRTRFYRRGQ